MATTPTTNPIPSESPRDLKFNAGKIDEIVNSTDDAFRDRFGVARLTWAGIENISKEAIAGIGFIPLDSFEDGATITTPNQVLRLQSTGDYYRWSGDFPKVVPAGSTPQTSGGVGPNAWLLVTDQALRALLASSSGASYVGFGSSTVQKELRRSLYSFGAKGDGLTDDTAAMNAAVQWAATQPRGAVIEVHEGEYSLSSEITWGGGSSQVFFESVNSGGATFSWRSGSASQGFKVGLSQPVSRLAVKGITFVTNAVSTSAAIQVAFNKASPKSLVLEDVSAYGGAVGGTVANGYWGDGLIVAQDPVYPIFENCYFFGIGGATSVTKSNLINSAYRITSTGGIFFSNFRNCFANNINNAVWLITSSVPGIEGTFIESCNFNSANIGVFAEAQNSGNNGYFPPQLFINNSQIEYVQRGIGVNHYGKVSIRGNLLYADPSADVALNHVLLTSVESAIVTDNYMESRPVHTQVDGVVLAGECRHAQVKNNQIQIPAGKFAVVFGGSSYQCFHSGNHVIGGNLYANTSTNSTQNTASSYVGTEESSVSLDGGFVLKAGSKVVTLGAGGSFTVNWIERFQNQCLSVTATSGDAAAVSGAISIGTYNVTGFTGFITGGTSGTQARINYTTLGR